MRKFTAAELRLLRQSRNLQQKDLAAIMKISTQRYSILENDEKRPDNRTLEILSALKYTPKSAKEFLDLIPPPRKTSRLKSM